MNKKYIFFVIIVSILFSLAGCKEKTNPKSSFEKYIKAWETKDFNSMYSILDIDSLTKIEEKTFIKKYSEIYELIEANKINVNPKYPTEFKEDENENIKIPFDVSLDTIGGKINFSEKAVFKKEKDDEDKEVWRIKWDYNMIFSNLEKNDIVKVNNTYGNRGEMYDRNDKPLAINNEQGKRVYPNNASAGFITGFTGAITDEDLKKEKYKDYNKNDIIGLAGLEYQYEERLKQKTGKEIIIADKNGNKKETLAKKEAQNGEKIKLTIDSQIQLAMHQQMANDIGVGVAMNPKTGEVLALVSTPGYDPNTNTGPPLNRFRYSYAPGSTFKVITSAIGFNAKKLDPNQDKQIYGTKWQKQYWGNYFVTRAHAYSPPSNFRNGMVYSDNIYFAQVALDVGQDLFINETKKFGIGEEFPFDIPLHTQSQLFNEAMNSEAQLADSAFGQGEILMNPIHLTTIYTFLTNDGNILKPKLVLEENMTPEIWKQQVCSKENTNLISKHLGEVVSSPDGTAHVAYIPDVPIMGKTGTAELKMSVDEEGTENGWFIGIEQNKMELEVCMFIEGVEKKGGSVYPAEKVKNIFNQFGR
ncbi:MAG: penicillin-binding transpeptidase domain-containing protein [Clostridiales bacterium]